MLQSHIIEIDGVFVGAAIPVDAGFRFVAVDRRVGRLDGSVLPSLRDTARQARSLIITDRSAPAIPGIVTVSAHGKA